MIDGKKVLATISARGGSKGIPRKNIKNLAGKPLLAWTILAAQASQYIDRIVLSTEDEEIAEVGAEFGADVPFMRPMNLALDGTSGIAPVIHALETLPEKYDYVILLQPTSPLRTGEDIDACLRYCHTEEAPCCVSMVESACSPYWMYTLDASKHLHPVIPQKEFLATRQAHPTTYEPNGSVYIARPDWLKKTNLFLTDETLGYVMSREHSWDIDEPFDFEVCELLMKKRLGL